MYEGTQAMMQAGNALGGYKDKDPMQQMTCGADFGEMMEPTQEQIGDVLTAIAARADSELMALEDTALAAEWYWRWEEGRSIEWNTYKFSDALEAHKWRCRRWEERHNGSCCVVERVRDKYVMPRVREFLAALATHNRY
ncbi:MAG: hypothetical protein RJA63_1231 [Pseudomonadota bacterium]|jgi:hypothetical protein